ncbi:hypothetical protein F6455_03905 [Proteobacteria bacterium 005FR1]|nr:hypothetical protein [Proteobacteria bacterium 005FR1]
MANPYDETEGQPSPDLGESTNASYASAKEGVEAMRDTAQATGERMENEAEAMYEEGRASLDEMVTRAEYAIIDHPLAAVGIAFAAGWVTSKLFR